MYSLYSLHSPFRVMFEMGSLQLYALTFYLTNVSNEKVLGERLSAQRLVYYRSVERVCFCSFTHVLSRQDMNEKWNIRTHEWKKKLIICIVSRPFPGSFTIFRALSQLSGLFHNFLGSFTIFWQKHTLQQLEHSWRWPRASFNYVLTTTKIHSIRRGDTFDKTRGYIR